MTKPADLKIVPFTQEYVPNPYPRGDLPWQVYHSVRNAVVRACRAHGATGPMGECPIIEADAPPYLGWEHGDPDAVYFVLDDQYNRDRYVYGEVYAASAFHLGWVADVTEALAGFPGWGLGIKNIPYAYVLMFASKLMIKGEMFRDCEDVVRVVEVVQRQLRLSCSP